MKKIRKGDSVIVITGRNKGQTGIVTTIRNDSRIIVAGINKVTKHVKPNPQREIAGGISQIEAPIHISNIMLLNPKTQKGDKVGIKTLEREDGRKYNVRFFKSNNELV
ncbi:50S ribosomal subunit protein L24 [Gammaproteobacteria bacterium]|nr:50S ribosomal subunit protein L24 [Gammaproteobacteria bacterium]